MKYNNDKLTKEQIIDAINHSNSMIGAARYLNVSRDKFKRFAKLYNVFIPNQSGKGINKTRIYNDEDIFTLCHTPVTPSILINRLKQKRIWRCEKCGIYEWMGNPISLEIHHIDGNKLNNNLNNLQILCPNCHSQTNNWRSRNKKGWCKTNPKVSDEQILEALKGQPNIYRALNELGLAGGANYLRVYKLLNNN